MIKLVALFKFKPGLAREDGIAYYEERHVPLILDLFPDHFVDYRRNYFMLDQLVVPDHVDAPPPPPTSDMMTELWFKSREQYEAMIAAMGDPAIGGRVAADEANFLDRASMTMFLVDERRTPQARS
jgi:uncharacterized protein (TIGR02118 family)